ncbi:MAG TPA: S8 family peptidase, partial [bacterium]
TVITIAADNAVARGMIVVNSAGNHGGWAYPGDKMSPPSDGDSVLAIGAANADSSRASFSSIGPTFDGRIKPDLMALGVSVKVASATDTTGYGFGSGTSFSTPITAGACALLLQADPTLTPMEVHAFLKASATQSLNPDTLMGWGIYDVWQAIQNALGIEPNYSGPITPQKFQIVGIYPNPFNADARVIFDLPAAGSIRLFIYDILGRQMAHHEPLDLLLGRQALIISLDDLSSGVYLVQLESPWGIQIAKVVMLK